MYRGRLEEGHTRISKGGEGKLRLNKRDTGKLKVQISSTKTKERIEQSGERTEIKKCVRCGTTTACKKIYVARKHVLRYYKGGISVPIPVLFHN
jgi:hypothetical protein